RKNPVPEGAGFFALCVEKHAGWRLPVIWPAGFVGPVSAAPPGNAGRTTSSGRDTGIKFR
ncbi:hypothetical protein UXO79_16390, partial [Enterobacter hormaechei]